MREGLPKILYDKMKREKCLSRDMLRHIGKVNGFDSATVDRKMRLLTQSGFVKPEIKKTFIVRYHWIEQKRKREKKAEPVQASRLF